MLYSLVTVDVIAVDLLKWGCLCNYTLAPGEGRMASKTLLITNMLCLGLNSSVPAALRVGNPTEFSKSGIASQSQCITWFKNKQLF